MKHLFFGLQARERYMALAALAVAAFLWITSSWGRTRDGWAAWQTLESDAATQVAWLNKQAEIKAAADIAIQGLDAGRGYDSTRLVEEALSAAKDAGLSPTTEAPKTQKSGKFAVHTLQLSCRRADLAAVVRFYQTISPRAPYIAINTLSLQSDRASSGTVTMVVTLSSLELITPVK
ncbi:MAG: hypothetical protein NTX41_02510 [Verrucomicrobia bacterium]|nr:hypothetical protein [Verrucomicrobiota bacterium]